MTIHIHPAPSEKDKRTMRRAAANASYEHPSTTMDELGPEDLLEAA